MTASPLVSVITPTYNHRSWIGECIDSVRAQSYRSWEQVVIDDGSPDGTADVALAARRGDPRIRVERQEHQGIEQLAATYNAALAGCRGSLIATLEGDDLWASDMLATLVPLFDQPDVVVAYGVAAVIDGGGRTGQQVPSARFKRLFGESALTNDPIGSGTRAILDRGGLVYTYPCATLIRRSSLAAIGGFIRFEDFGSVDLPTYASLSLLGRFKFVDTILAEWRMHRAGASWRRHDVMLTRARDYVRYFCDAHAAQLGSEAVHEIDRSWRDHAQLLALDSGRRALVERQWPEARVNFALAMRGSGFVKAAAILGYGASWVRTDIERLVRLTGRGIDFRSLRQADMTEVGLPTRKHDQYAKR